MFQTCSKLVKHFDIFLQLPPLAVETPFAVENLYWSVTINRTTFVHADFMIFKLEI
jgi:hypothetical protein